MCLSQDMNRRLMHEQNREYEESLEADRVRDMQREQERQRLEAQRREEEEAAARERYGVCASWKAVSGADQV